MRQTFLHVEKNGRWSKALTEFLSFPKARHSGVPENCEGLHRQAGRTAIGWICACWWGEICWLPFSITTWCLIHPNLPHYGSTRVPPVIRDIQTLNQPELHCCRNTRKYSNTNQEIWQYDKEEKLMPVMLLFHLTKKKSRFSKNTWQVEGEPAL